MLSELLRRLHTGSYLLARGGKPLFEIYLTNFLKDAINEIDPEIFTKARIALAEDAETIAKSLAEVMDENEKCSLHHWPPILLWKIQRSEPQPSR